ncbi:hypothetical protein AKJ63_00360 [candidate division MSBL1 archaeon SCGC-AAA259D18]|uniref:Transglutaminase-like domain-containing protein n=1 Tax=candidate division MSBL1 archaeon SCGC-AAA259D18 TaxID=1698262 RepID=A0A133UCK2_9EURY|nr:hypothetical protein AKJ63_00360 [candidate division MSBL1 archaeon SCGC-AAA259D18]
MKTLNVTIIVAIALAITFSGVIVMIQEEEGGKEETENEPTGTDNEPGETGVVFKENGVTSLYVDAFGDAEGELVDQLSDSKLADIVKFSVQKMGEDRAELVQVESLRKRMTRYGMEVESATCDVQGVGGEGPLVTTMSWEISNFARREENHWSISFEWVDNLAAARGILAEEKDTWVLVRNTAQNFNIPAVSYRRISHSHIILPKGSQNVQYSVPSEELVTRYGGGTYDKSSISLKRVGDRPHVIENMISVTLSENKITVTTENLLENSRPYRISYQRDTPESWCFLNSIDSVRLDLKYGMGPRKNYWISDVEGNEYRLGLEEILYCTADKIISIVEGEEFSIQIPSFEGVSSWGETDWEASWELLPKEEYVDLAREVRKDWSAGKEIRGPVDTSIGKVGLRNLTYTFTRVLDSYGEGGDLPGEIRFAPSLSWGLSLDGEEISPEIAYFLLSEPDVLTNTPAVENIVSEVRGHCQSRIELPKKLLKWTNKNITYNILSFGATSEEILKSREGKCADFSNVYLALLRSAGIPARRVSGWIVYDPSTWSPPEEMGFVVGKTPDGRPIAGHAWTEVFLPQEGWTPADPTAGRFENLPYEIYLPARQSWMDALGAYETTRGPL